ncbi:hypothetical protein [Pseudomonas amygdali]|uniref:Uncharacterized protein n=1 Tax=Pseudomonas amygdali pv. lachrymans str. M301315 TaxID=629260 RepID=A0AAD0V9T0_PSEAV|nr:hypothetical protein [Pseudomonas amygdali]AXH59993.1 hypothetical protein PLA107_032725 [Pseudomonas amygdali pv. lachrymans str. M301315]RMT06449.1 hypothetical protein ALP54_03850 [Pseudomonas amygdali pv. lachrymans]
MKLIIPRLGDLLVLTKDWSFPVMHEHRNTSIIAHDGVKYVPTEYVTGTWERIYTYSDHTLKAGTVLSIARYYIRQGAGEFDSITFVVHAIDGVKLKKKLRFFVSTDAAAQADFEYQN